MTLKAGIVGWPVTHSLSPVLHGHWLSQHGIDGEIVRVPATPDDFAATIARLRAEGYRGINVTVPHKEAAFALADRKHASAGDAGAANLLIFRKDGIEAFNTDTTGLAESLRQAGPDLTGKTAVLLGAGGAARGAVLALDMLGAKTIHLLNRDPRRAAALAGFLSLRAEILPAALTDWSSVAGDAALVVNTTSAGMTGNPPLDIDLSVLPQNATVCDIVYKPLETPLLKAARARKLQTIDGLGMLMHQAVPSFEAFFGVRPEVTPGLRAALIEALDGF